MQELKYVKIDGVNYKLGGKQESSGAAKQFTFRSEKETFRDAIDWLLQGMQNGPEQMMQELMSETGLIDLIRKYCVKSREEIGLTDEVLEGLKSGEVPSQFIMAPGQPMIYGILEMMKLAGLPPEAAESFPVIEISESETATLESLAPCSFALSGINDLNELFMAYDIARGRVMGLLSDSGSDTSTMSISSFLDGRGLGLPSDMIMSFIEPVLGTTEVKALLGYFAEWGIGLPIDLIMGGGSSSGSSTGTNIPLKADLDCSVIVTETEVAYLGTFTILLLCFLFVVIGGYAF